MSTPNRTGVAGFCDAADGLEGYAARCFDRDPMACRVVQRYRGSHVGQAEFVEHDDVRACAQRLLKLLHRFHFHFHFDFARTGCAAGCCHCGRQGAGCGDVVFLDQHLVEEPDAVVLAAATHHRVFLRRP